MKYTLTMFDLPLGTTLLLFGFPLLWIVYTIGFLIVTRSWRNETRPPKSDS